MAVNSFVGTEPNAEIPPVREFIDGTQVPYSDLQELRDAMVIDDMALIDGIANRRRRDALMVGEFAAAGFTLDINHTAQVRMPDLVAERHPGDTDLEDLLLEIYPELAPESSSIQLYDYSIVEAVASRLEKAKLATVFKRDQSEGIAPAQQAKNQERAVKLAADRHPEDSELPEVIDNIYSVLIPKTVAIQQLEFAKTRILP